MKYIKLLPTLLIIWLVLSQNIAKADNRIVGYLKNAPPEIINQTIKEIQSENLQNKTQTIKINHTDKTALKSEFRKLLTPKLSGFFAIYAGYMDISNKDGLIQFPLRQAANKLYIAFTEKINLIKVKDNTFSHKQFANPQKHPTKLYLYEKQEDEKKNKFWKVQEVPLPKDKKISPLTLVIFTRPTNVFIETGAFICSNSQHMVLPEIYIIDTQDQALSALNILKVKRFFEPVKFEEKPATEKSTQGMATNT
jgi:hypothetical protein